MHTHLHMSVTHIYSYKCLEHRERVRAAAYADARWQAFIAASRPHVAAQVSTQALCKCVCVTHTLLCNTNAPMIHTPHRPHRSPTDRGPFHNDPQLTAGLFLD